MDPMYSPWTYPTDRYYYGWYSWPLPRDLSDHEIKAIVVERLRENPHTEPFDLKVDVKERVVILQGDVHTPLAKRAAADDAWDISSVRDVSNQITVTDPAH